MITYVSLFEKLSFYRYPPKVVRNQQKASLYVTPKYHQPFPLLLNVYAVAHSASLLRTSIFQRSVDKEIPDKLLSHFAPFRSSCLQLQKDEIFYVNSLNAISSLLL